MKKEFWRPVVGYEGLYMVSNWGRVKSLPRNGTVKYARILKPGTNGRGYLIVCLCKNGKGKTFKVHRLVAEAFLPNSDNLPCVNHKDECKTNNNAENLEWCSAKHNNNYGTRTERAAKKCSKKNTNGKLSKKVLQYDLEGNFIREWKSTAECNRNGYNHGAVAACCRGELKKYKDSIWRYK